MATNNSAVVTFGYRDSDFTRKYRFSGLSAADLTGVKDAVLAINASVKAGTDGGFAEFFRADDYDDSDPQNIVGGFKSIVAAETDVTIETEIDLSGN